MTSQVIWKRAKVQISLFHAIVHSDDFLHNRDMYPWIQLGSLIYIPTFFIIVSLAASLSLVIYTKQIHLKNLETRFHLNLALVLMGFGLLGGRLAHVLIEYPSYYLHAPEKIFFLWEGGYVFYGGLFLSAFAGLIYYRRNHSDWSQLDQSLDAIAPAASFSYALGRWGCFFAGCCYGKFCELPWAFQGRHPVQIYSSLWELGAFCLILGLSKRQTPPAAGILFWLWILLHGMGRFITEIFRDDYRGPDLLFSISGWFSVGLIFLAIYFLSQKRLSKS